MLRLWAATAGRRRAATATRPRPREPPATTRGRTPRRAFPPAVAIAARTRRSCVLRPTRAPQGSFPSSAPMRASTAPSPAPPPRCAIRQQEVIVAEAAEDEVANRRSEGSGALSAESVGASAALISICVIISRITGFARTWAMAFALGSTFVSSSYQVANNLPNMLYELVMGGMLITAFLPVYLSVKKQLGDRRGNEYASNLLTIVVVLLGYRLGALHGVRRADHLYPELLLEPGRDGARRCSSSNSSPSRSSSTAPRLSCQALLNANREYFCVIRRARGRTTSSSSPRSSCMPSVAPKPTTHLALPTPSPLAIRSASSCRWPSRFRP